MLKKSILTSFAVSIFIGLAGCSTNKPKVAKSLYVKKPVVKQQVSAKKAAIVPVVYEKRSPRIRKTVRRHQKPVRRHYPRKTNSFAGKLSNAALGRLRSRVRYDGSYVKIAYPWGDVPANIGVCTDVVIRSYRKLGIDLQSEVHQDMRSAFNSYPNLRKWGLKRPDTNIDHRRVYNLRNFFARKGAGLPITRNPSDYQPGDLVTWMVGPNLPHIGVVVNRRSKADPRRFMIVHNIAEGPKMEDVLFRFQITGHYRYTPAHAKNRSQAVYAGAKKSRRNNNQMSTTQLRAAASLLGAIGNKTQPTRRKTKSQNNDALLLATLSDDKVRRLLAR
ncbi:MAG: DUF1287 domain-containing protein [Cocleimonas sp.]